MIAAIRAAPCLRIDATRAARVEFLLRDYAYFLAQPEQLAAKLSHLRTLQGDARISAWQALIAAGNFAQLVEELLEYHYDPLYQRSQSKNYTDFSAAQNFTTADLSAEGISRLAEALQAA
jgi:tRNA 2-selenouridine synthase